MRDDLFFSLHGLVLVISACGGQPSLCYSYVQDDTAKIYVNHNNQRNLCSINKKAEANAPALFSEQYKIAR